jgi:hypothetical protein
VEELLLSVIEFTEDQRFYAERNTYTEPLIPDSIPIKVEIAIVNLKIYK